jgi:nucleoporin NUP1
MNAAEKALQELDIYKTPLLPSRLRLQSEGPMSAEIPDMLRHNKVKVPVPDRRRKVSRQHDEGPPRLGMKPVSNKKERSTKERKPYAGEGGAKKLLARRRREEAEIGGDASVDNNESMQEAGKDNNDTDAPAAQKPTIADSADAFPLVPNTDFGKDDFAPGAPTTGASSLRVGRAKTSRASRPEPAPTRRPGGSRFSAAMEDEEEERHIETRVQPSAAPMYKAPKGFDFGAPPQVSVFSTANHSTIDKI